MASIKAIEQIYKTVFNSNPQLKARYFKLLKTNPKEAQKLLNSIFTDYLSGIKNGVKSGINYLATATPITIVAANQAKGSENPEYEKSKKLNTTQNFAKKMETNPIKPLTEAEKKKLASKGRQDLIRASENTTISLNQYLQKKGVSPDKGLAEDETNEYLLLLLPSAKKVKGGMANLASIGKTFNQILKTKGVKAAEQYAKTATAKLKNEFVKQAPKAKATINSVKVKVRNEIDKSIGKLTGGKHGDMSLDQYLNKYGKDYTEGTLDELFDLTANEAKAVNKAAKSGFDSLTEKESQSFIDLVKENAADIKKMAEEVGATKAEIPHVIKFINSVGDMLKNSPNYIRNVAAGKKTNLWGLAGNSAFSIYDLWNEYKNNEYTFFGDSVAKNAGRMIAGSLVPGFGKIPGVGPITSLLMGGLGYTATDKLGRASLRRLGVTNVMLSDKEKEEVRQGIRQPGASGQVGEYEQGFSGRRYHLVNDKFYAYDTGKVVPFRQAMSDINKGYEFKLNQVNDQLASVQAQKADMEQAASLGYNVDPEAYQQLQLTEDNLVSQIRDIDGTLKKLDFSDDYNDNEDLISQVYNKEIIPQQQNTQISQMANQQARQNNFQDVYNLINQQYSDNINNYFTPENLAIDYMQYMRGVGAGENVYIEPEQFAKIMKAKAMYNAQPQVQQVAMQQLQLLEDLAIKQGNLGVKQGELDEASRNHYVQAILKQLKDAEDARHNRVNEQIGYGNLYVNQQKANVAQQNANVAANRANTYQQYVDIQKSLQPYRQLESMGSAMAGAGMIGGETGVNQLINANPELGKQVFPAAFQEPEQPQQQEQQGRPLNLIEQYKQLRGQK